MSTTPDKILQTIPATLKADQLTKAFPTPTEPLSVLREVSLELSGGDAVAIMGPSGSGKSTMLHILATLETPSSGTVTINGENPFALSEPALATFRNRHIGLVFQDHHLLPQCNAIENVLLPALAGRQDSGVVERGRNLLDRVGLTARAEHLPAELSGGERQRVAIARALIHGPGLLLCDEPTGNLDHHTADSVADLLFELHQDEQTILIAVTHSLELAKRFDRRGELQDGRLVWA
jgi:lipoprotein-releasing system ATP-binding protein